MNSTLRDVLTFIAIALVGELIHQLSLYVFKKYRIYERKLSLRVFILLIVGLFLIVLPLVFLVIDLGRGSGFTLTIFLYWLAILVGVLILIYLVWLVVHPGNIPPVKVSVLDESQIEPSAIGAPTVPKTSKTRTWGWILTIGGILLTAACVYLFLAYGPQHDPPGMSAEHRLMDTYTNYFCASVALIGLVLFVVGLRKLTRKEKLPL